ncbi:hypothetical protein PAT3040_03417 [Paenibacillus agaridevorans]|uniref:Uncharacterized protein n=2 Tax=Paenibacillus TaxID=44249 RepID=A0A2R5EQ32_9BACL|nr:hypothetical protein PAT3040_03417 [Paenibacillus agaridevorans]
MQAVNVTKKKTQNRPIDIFRITTHDLQYGMIDGSAIYLYYKAIPANRATGE